MTADAADRGRGRAMIEAALTDFHALEVFFTVDDDTSVVRVVDVRRGARRRPTPGELSDR